MTELILNPHLMIRPMFADRRMTAYVLSAPVKGRGRLHHVVPIADSDAELVGVLAGLVDADGDVDVGDAVCATLQGLGVLVEDHEVSAPVRFCCRLEAAASPVATSLVVNPDVRVVAFADFAASEPGLARWLAPCDHLALVTDAWTGVRYPYWLDAREHVLVQRVRCDPHAATRLDPVDAAKLAAAGILLDPASVAAARDHLAAAIAHFAAGAYVRLPQLIPPLQLAALRRYACDLVGEGYAADHDDQVADRAVLHNERLMQYYHHQLSRFFIRVTRQQLKPSYGYFASYRRGARLAKHVDREQCKLTLSLLLDYGAQPGDDAVWPLYLEPPDRPQRISVELAPGDGVLFSGCEQPHYRDALRGERSTSLFCHYVDEAFSGSLW